MSHEWYVTTTTTSGTAVSCISTVSALGPLRVDGVRVTPAQRSLLAALVLHRRRGATVDDLVDAVWSDHAPASATASVQNQISRLRRRLGQATIVFDANRYVLTSPTDVDRFESVGASARHPACALVPGAIEDALALWRGTPYDELSNSVDAQIERRRLESLQARLIERLAIEYLTAGRHDDATAVLQVRVGAEPLHERAWELLIASEYLAGRRTTALAEFVELEGILSDRLDIHPSAPLRRLNMIVSTERPLDLTTLVAHQPPSGQRDERRLA